MQGKLLFQSAVGRGPQILVQCTAANITFPLNIFKGDARTFN
jgi:hypothetical protein